MVIELISGIIRVQFSEDIIDFRVIGENGERGVDDALDFIEQLQRHLQHCGAQHEAQQRKYGDHYRTDAVIIPLRKRIERLRETTEASAPSTESAER